MWLPGARPARRGRWALALSLAAACLVRTAAGQALCPEWTAKTQAAATAAAGCTCNTQFAWARQELATPSGEKAFQCRKPVAGEDVGACPVSDGKLLPVTGPAIKKEYAASAAGVVWEPVKRYPIKVTNNGEAGLRVEQGRFDAAQGDYAMTNTRQAGKAGGHYAKPMPFGWIMIWRRETEPPERFHLSAFADAAGGEGKLIGNTAYVGSWLFDFYIGARASTAPCAMAAYTTAGGATWTPRHFSDPIGLLQAPFVAPLDKLYDTNLVRLNVSSAEEMTTGEYVWQAKTGNYIINRPDDDVRAVLWRKSEDSTFRISLGIGGRLGPPWIAYLYQAKRLPACSTSSTCACAGGVARTAIPTRILLDGELDFAQCYYCPPPAGASAPPGLTTAAATVRTTPAAPKPTRKCSASAGAVEVSIPGYGPVCLCFEPGQYVCTGPPRVRHCDLFERFVQQEAGCPTCAFFAFNAANLQLWGLIGAPAAVANGYDLDDPRLQFKVGDLRTGFYPNDCPTCKCTTGTPTTPAPRVGPPTPQPPPPATCQSQTAVDAGVRDTAPSGAAGTCTFPFVRQGTSHSACVDLDLYAGVGWCSWDPVYTAESKRWGYCTPGCPVPSNVTGEVVQTSETDKALCVKQGAFPVDATPFGLGVTCVCLDPEKRLCNDPRQHPPCNATALFARGETSCEACSFLEMNEFGLGLLALARSAVEGTGQSLDDPMFSVAEGDTLAGFAPRYCPGCVCANQTAPLGNSGAPRTSAQPLHTW